MPNVRNGLAGPKLPDLASMDLGEMEGALEQIGHPRYHARQIFSWIYARA
jgi:adenine C2-methylase RlmN of 23S rRNA A2503 and tRNA A37